MAEAVGAGDVETAVEQRGTRSVLAASLSRRAVRRIRREERRARAGEVAGAVQEALEAQRPLKISELVEATGCERSEILDVLRAGRDAETPTFFSFNETNSNFHMSWSTDPDNGIFPVPVEAAPEAEAEVAEAEAEAEVAEAEGEIAAGADEE
jgi:hypothetical protein